MKEFDIKRNKMTRGFYSVVEKEGNFYYIDLSFTFDRGIECMAYPSDKEGKVSDWGEVFVAYPEEISENALKDCIEKFLLEE